MNRPMEYIDTMPNAYFTARPNAECDLAALSMPLVMVPAELPILLNTADAESRAMMSMNRLALAMRHRPPRRFFSNSKAKSR